MKDIIYIRKLRVDALIGVYDWEQTVRQTLIIDVEMQTDIDKAGRTDNVDDALDYALVASRLKAVVEDTHFQLLEALIERLVVVLQSEFGIPWLRLCVGKPGAVPSAEEVGLIVERVLPVE